MASSRRRTADAGLGRCRTSGRGPDRGARPDLRASSRCRTVPACPLIGSARMTSLDVGDMSVRQLRDEEHRLAVALREEVRSARPQPAPRRRAPPRAPRGVAVIGADRARSQRSPPVTAIDMPVLQLGQWRLHPGQTRAYQQWARGSGLIGPACECSVELGSGGCVTDMSFDVRTSVQVGTTPTLLISTGTAVGTIIIQNLGPYPITITDAAGIVQGPVLFSDGDPLVLDDVTGSLYATCPVAQSAPADTRVFGGAQGWTDPVSDLAPWIDPTAPESARFLGVFVTRIDGLDDGVTSRSMTNRVGGGGAPGATTIGPRGLRLEGLLLATDVAALEWGKRWWAALGPSAGLVNGARLHRRADQRARRLLDPWLDLFDVIAPSGPAWSDTQCCGTAVAFTLDLSAGQPWLFERPVTLASGLLGDGAGATCGCGAVIIGGGFDAPFTECPACSACPDAPADCLVDPHVPAVTAPTWVAGATDFDEHGRPNCGPGSANFGSGAEVAWTDPSGRTSTSGHFLDTAGEQPAFDHFGAPSCGSGSAIHGAYPAAPGGTVTLFSASEVATSWVAQGTTITGSRRRSSPGSSPTSLPRSGASVRNVTRQIVWRNANASPPVRAGSGLLQVRLAPTSSAVDLDGGSVMPPVGWVAGRRDRMGAAHHRRVRDRHRDNAHGDPDPVAERRPVPCVRPCGTAVVRSGERALRRRDPGTRSAGPPSCGSGSATYGAESPIPDWAGRCAAPGPPTTRPALLLLPERSCSSSRRHGIRPGPRSPTSTSRPRRLRRSRGTGAPPAPPRRPTPRSSTCTTERRTAAGVVAGHRRRRARADVPAVGVRRLPGVHRTCVACGLRSGSPVKVRFSVEPSTPGIPVIGFATFGAASAIAGPNAGTDRAVRRRRTAVWTGHASKGRTTAPQGCAAARTARAPARRAARTPGMTASSSASASARRPWTFSWFAPDWASIAAPDGALPTLATRPLPRRSSLARKVRRCPVSRPARRARGGSTARRRVRRIPEAPPTNLLCDGSRILSARLVVKFTPPPATRRRRCGPVDAAGGVDVRCGLRRLAQHDHRAGTRRGRLPSHRARPADHHRAVTAQRDRPARSPYRRHGWFARLHRRRGSVRRRRSVQGLRAEQRRRRAVPRLDHLGADRPGWADPADPVVRCETVVPPSNADAVSVYLHRPRAGPARGQGPVVREPDRAAVPVGFAIRGRFVACTTPLATALIPASPQARRSRSPGRRTRHRDLRRC